MKNEHSILFDVIVNLVCTASNKLGSKYIASNDCAENYDDTNNRYNCTYGTMKSYKLFYN